MYLLAIFSDRIYKHQSGSPSSKERFLCAPSKGLIYDSHSLALIMRKFSI